MGTYLFIFVGFFFGGGGAGPSHENNVSPYIHNLD